MLEKPDLQLERLLSSLRDAYGLQIAELAFLPLGVDRRAAVYRVLSQEGRAYFLKLRGGVWNERAVTLPRFLSDQGVKQVIPPLPTKAGQLWADLDPYRLILYPFVEGKNGYEVGLTNRQWHALGTALKRIHTTTLPPALERQVQRETYSPRWRSMLKSFLARLEQTPHADAVAAELAAFMRGRRQEIVDLVERAERLALAVQACEPQFVLCHADIHAGNVLLGSDGALYIVDWDDAARAPKERDLMFIGGGYWGEGRAPQEQQSLFYEGYGRTSVDRELFAYYRYGRIVEDVALFCQHICETNRERKDREQSLRYLKSHFAESGTLAIAHRSDTTTRNR